MHNRAATLGRKLSTAQCVNGRPGSQTAGCAAHHFTRKLLALAQHLQRRSRSFAALEVQSTELSHTKLSKCRHEKWFFIYFLIICMMVDNFDVCQVKFSLSQKRL